jgi:hypothetical protein
MTDTQQLDGEAYEDRDLDAAEDDLDGWDRYDDAEEAFDVDYEDFLDWLNRRN